MKTIFYEEISHLKKVEEKEGIENTRQRLGKKEIRKLRMYYENLPVEYIDFLKNIGAGSFREKTFRIYEGVFYLEELGIYPSIDVNDKIKFFGDDYEDEYFGFDLKTKDCLVIEYSPGVDETIHETGKTFKEYIREKIFE
ncbi:hypothetical protein [Tenacibaculum sp.]|uniref:hypothetical protein n=1 Tax=Tenacibaculum sp. TaxID=1906242 RepID=UPI003AA93CFF